MRVKTLFLASALLAAPVVVHANDWGDYISRVHLAPAKYACGDSFPSPTGEADITIDFDKMTVTILGFKRLRNGEFPLKSKNVQAKIIRDELGRQFWVFYLGAAEWGDVQFIMSGNNFVLTNKLTGDQANTFAICVPVGGSFYGARATYDLKPID